MYCRYDEQKRTTTWVGLVGPGLGPVGLSGLITDILHKINVNNNNVLMETCTNDNLEKCTSKIIWIYYYGIMVEHI